MKRNVRENIYDDLIAESEFPWPRSTFVLSAVIFIPFVSSAQKYLWGTLLHSPPSHTQNATRNVGRVMSSWKHDAKYLEISDILQLLQAELLCLASELRIRNMTRNSMVVVVVLTWDGVCVCGNFITHAHSTIFMSVDSTKSTAHSYGNGQVSNTDCTCLIDTPNELAVLYLVFQTTFPIRFLDSGTLSSCETGIFQRTHCTKYTTCGDIYFGRPRSSNLHPPFHVFRSPLNST
jgi:hypothetical protein